MTASTHTLLSYNLWEDRATHEINELTKQYQPDVVCLQESSTALLPSKIGNLTLADATKRNRLGLAIYYDARRLRLDIVKSFALNKSLHDRVLAPAHERLLAARFTDIADGTTFVAASFHASPLSARNGVRRKQIASAHQLLQTFSEDGTKIAAIMAGDYNYPLFQKKLVRKLEKTGHELNRSDKSTYARWLRGHYDFMTSTGLTIDSVKTLPRGISDHLPILAKFTVDSSAQSPRQSLQSLRLDQQIE